VFKAQGNSPPRREESKGFFLTELTESREFILGVIGALAVKDSFTLGPQTPMLLTLAPGAVFLQDSAISNQNLALRLPKFPLPPCLSPASRRPS
jgi:hypothetical protein